MKTRLRIIVAAFAGLLFAGAPALAQETADPASENAVIGPPQLQNFSLNGTVTREGPEPAQVAPQARQEPQRQPPAQATQSRSEPAVSASSPPPSPESRQPVPNVAQPTQPAIESGSFQADDSPLTDSAPSEPPTGEQSAAAASIADTAGAGSVLPWLLASLVLGGAAAWFFLRQRPRASYAGAGGIDRFEAPPVPAAPVPAAPRVAPAAPAPAPSQSAPAGVVSTRLRPWLEIEFNPLRAVVDDQRAAVAFELAVFNSGSVPARDVLLEASLFNAGPAQDQQIELFFDNPVGKGDRIPVIPPLQRVSVETAVFLQRDQVRPIEVEGRSLFVPLIGFNVLYSWGRGEGQTSASYLVGKQTSGEKLAPFRLDLGSRISRSLAAREHELRRRT